MPVGLRNASKGLVFRYHMGLRIDASVGSSNDSDNTVSLPGFPGRRIFINRVALIPTTVWGANFGDHTTWTITFKTGEGAGLNQFTSVLTLAQVQAQATAGGRQAILFPSIQRIIAAGLPVIPLITFTGGSSLPAAAGMRIATEYAYLDEDGELLTSFGNEIR